jgi:hypothetical protein
MHVIGCGATWRVWDVMRFVEGCDFGEFSRYLAKLGQYTGDGELDKLRRSLESGLFNLIVFRKDREIAGHAIWHETNTEEHRKGNPREKEDKEILQGFIGSMSACSSVFVDFGYAISSPMRKR